MAQDIVRFIKIQTGDSERSINQLNKEISQLSDELNGLTINSKRYNEVSKELAIRQKELTSINQSLQVASRTTQQRFENLQKFSSGLTAGFTTLASTFALLGTGSENFDKTITKLTGSLAILQSIGGLKDLIESFPGVINGFKNIGDSIKRFFTGAVNSFDPLERRLTTAANNLKNIGKIDIKADIKTSGTKDIQTPIITNTNKQLAEQQKTLVPLNEQWQKYTEALQANKKELEEAVKVKKLDRTEIEKKITLNKDLIATVKELQDIELAADKIAKKRKPVTPDALDLDTYSVEDLNKAAATLGKSYDEVYNKYLGLIDQGAKAFNVNAQNFKNLKGELKTSEQALDDLNRQIAANEKAIQQAEFATTKLGKAWNITKQIFSTVGWTLVITALVTAAYKLFDYIKTLKTAAKEQREFNQELNKTTSELSSSKLAKFYELQKAFEAIGNSTESKKKFLEDYSDQLKETGLAINDVQTAEDAFINNTDKYVQAIIARAKIDAYKEQITKKTQETLEKNLELERKIESGEYKTSAIAQSQAGVVGQGYISKDDLETQQKVVEQARKKLEDEIKENNKELNDFITNQVGNISKLNKEYSALWATNDKGTKETSKSTSKTVDIPDIQLPDIQPLLDEISKEIDDFIEAEYDVVLGDREKELRELEEKWFKPYKELYETYGGDINQLTEEYERRRKAIIDKYKPKNELEEQLKEIREAYELEVGLITKKSPKTTYKQFGQTFQYQSGKDVEKELNSTLTYNQRIYEATVERINKENEAYQNRINQINEELKAENLSEEEKKKLLKERDKLEKSIDNNDIERENAKERRDQANTEAWIARQKKRQQAAQQTVAVVSSVNASMGSIFDSIAQINQMNIDSGKLSEEQVKKAEKRRDKASKTAKGFKAAQAVIDALSAANGAYSSMSSIPYVGPALGAAAAAAALIAGYANVKQILAQDVSGSTIQQATGTPASVNVPAISYTRNLVGDKELEEINKPQVCLVVEDLNNVQNRMQVRESNATF